MKVFICFAVVLAAVAAEKCFNEELIKTDAKPIVDKCKEKLGAEIENLPKEDKRVKIGQCMLEDQGMYTSEGKLDIEKYKTESEKYIVSKKDEILKKLDEVHAANSDSCAAFLKALKQELKKLCPEDKLECEEL